uniref:Uncharacterized protein n=1 Tax=Octopus bimaculoides TaxID=37653 RepID=A0A0L8GWF6_OCTBM
MKLALVLLVLLPLALSASLGESESETAKRSLIDLVIHHLHSLDLSKGCVKACEENVAGIGEFFCEAACKILLQSTHSTASP